MEGRLVEGVARGEGGAVLSCTHADLHWRCICQEQVKFGGEG
jgi:hypothetical protein